MVRFIPGPWGHDITRLHKNPLVTFGGVWPCTRPYKAGRPSSEAWNKWWVYHDELGWWPGDLSERYLEGDDDIIGRNTIVISPPYGWNICCWIETAPSTGWDITLAMMVTKRYVLRRPILQKKDSIQYERLMFTFCAWKINVPFISDIYFFHEGTTLPKYIISNTLSNLLFQMLQPDTDTSSPKAPMATLFY